MNRLGVLILLIAIETVWTQDVRPIEDPQRTGKFGFGILEPLRNMFCNSNCKLPKSVMFIRDLSCLVKCPEFYVHQNDQQHTTPTTTVSSTLMPTTPATTTTSSTVKPLINTDKNKAETSKPPENPPKVDQDKLDDDSAKTEKPKIPPEIKNSNETMQNMTMPIPQPSG